MLARTDGLPVAMVGEPPTTAEELFGLLAGCRPDWHADALCREHPEVNFFPARGDDTRTAQALCSVCLVVDECRTWALDQGCQLHGVWGGTTHQGRKRLRTAAA